jgi:large subunit ribosomal protein L4
MQGKAKGEIEIDPAVLGGRVRARLIKQAIVAYLDHQRQHSARTKGRGEVAGSTRKLYRQKGTGNARVGNIRTPIRKGGGRTFAKRGPRSEKQIPIKMRRLACSSAILAKIQSGDVMVVDDLAFPEVKTKTLAAMFTALGASRSCTLAIHERDEKAYLSGRNIADASVRVVDELNAYEVLRGAKLIFSKPAFERLIAGSKPAQAKGADA